MNPRVGCSTPVSSWSHVQLSLDKTLKPGPLEPYMKQPVPKRLNNKYIIVIHGILLKKK